MTTQVQTKDTTPLAVFAERFGMDVEDMKATIKGTLFKGKVAPTEAQVATFLIVANELKLNPWSKMIYAFPEKGGNGIIPMVGADGWYHILANHPQANGCPTELIEDANGKVIACKATLYRKDWDHPFIAIEKVSECSTGSGPWTKSPGRMIRHRAVAQAVRGGLGIGAVYTPDEAQEIYEAQYEVKRSSKPASGSSVDHFQQAIKARAQEATQEAQELTEPLDPADYPRFETDEDGTVWEIGLDEGVEIRMEVPQGDE